MGKIIAFSGSNSKNSINQKLIEEVAGYFTIHDVEIISLRDYEAPVYGIDYENEIGIPETMVELNNRFNEADGFLISSPEHNGSMPAVLKNTIDWISRIDGKVFKNKPTVFMSTSPGARGGASALNHLVTIMPYRGANIVGHLSLGSFAENFVEGKLIDSKKMEFQALVGKLEGSL